MRLIRLKLRGSQFWNLPPIKLNALSTVSPLINVDLLTDRQKEIIDRSLKLGDVLGFGSDGSPIKTLADVNILNGNFIDDSDDDEVDNTIPEIRSVTVSDDEDKENDVSKSEILELDQDMINRATMLLNRNGNTVRKDLLAINKTSEGLLLLKAYLAAESTNKNRPGIISLLNELIGE
jgi:predicted DNA binding protein